MSVSPNKGGDVEIINTIPSSYPATSKFASSESVLLQAVPAHGYTFDHWSDGGAETHTVTPQADVTYTAYYTGDDPNVTVTVAVSPQGKGLQVEVGGTRYVEGETFTWQKGSTHTVKAVSPQTGNDGYTYTFDRWSDGGGGVGRTRS